MYNLGQVSLLLPLLSSFIPNRKLQLTNPIPSQSTVLSRRLSFTRVEKALGTHNTALLPQCYAHTSREALFAQGLEMGKACLEDMKEYEHEHFVWITPKYRLVNARYVYPSLSVSEKGKGEDRRGKGKEKGTV